jgi:hypothetical protein
MYTPVQVVVIANAAAIALYVFNFTLPGTTTDKKNWKKLKDVLAKTADSALTLLPALSSLILTSPSSIQYLALGTGFWVLGWGVGTTIPSACTGTDVAPAGCSKTQFSTYQLSNGFTIIGASLGVGSILSYMKNMKLE